MTLAYLGKTRFSPNKSERFHSRSCSRSQCSRRQIRCLSVPYIRCKNRGNWSNDRSWHTLRMDIQLRRTSRLSHGRILDSHQRWDRCSFPCTARDNLHTASYPLGRFWEKEKKLLRLGHERYSNGLLTFLNCGSWTSMFLCIQNVCILSIDLRPFPSIQKNILRSKLRLQ